MTRSSVPVDKSGVDRFDVGGPKGALTRGHVHAIADTGAMLPPERRGMKQFTAWRVRQRSGGVLEWTCPLGRTYVENPPTLGVHFRPPDDRLPDVRRPDDRPPEDRPPDDAPF